MPSSPTGSGKRPRDRASDEDLHSSDPHGQQRMQATLSALTQGQIAILLDTKGTAHLVMAAQHADTKAISFFVKHTSGLIRVALPRSRADELALPPMRFGGDLAWDDLHAVAVDAMTGISTGISAADRARVIRILSDPEAAADDLARSGHVLPLRTDPDGVLGQFRHPEACVDLCVMADCQPAAVLSEITGHDGEILRTECLQRFLETYDLNSFTANEVAKHRLRRVEVTREGSCLIPVGHGLLTAVNFRAPPDYREHLALISGQLGTMPEPVVVVHRECVIGQILGPGHYTCQGDITRSMSEVSAAGGVLIYLRIPEPHTDPRSVSRLGLAESILDHDPHPLTSAILRDLGIRPTATHLRNAARCKVVTSAWTRNSSWAVTAKYLTSGKQPYGANDDSNHLR